MDADIAILAAASLAPAAAAPAAAAATAIAACSPRLFCLRLRRLRLLLRMPLPAPPLLSRPLLSLQLVLPLARSALPVPRLFRRRRGALSLLLPLLSPLLPQRLVLVLLSLSSCPAGGCFASPPLSLPRPVHSAEGSPLFQVTLWLARACTGTSPCCTCTWPFASFQPLSLPLLAPSCPCSCRCLRLSALSPPCCFSCPLWTACQRPSPTSATYSASPARARAAG